MRIAIAQILSSSDPSENLEAVRDYAAAAKELRADLVVFPEATMCAFGHALESVAEPLDGPWASEVRRIAHELGLVVVAGMFTPGRGGRVRNTLLVCGPGVDTHYDKIHLFDAFGYAESETVDPGEVARRLRCRGHHRRTRNLLRHPFPRPVHRQCQGRRAGQHRLRVLGSGGGQGGPVGPPHPRTGPGQHHIPHRRRPSQPGFRGQGDDGNRPHRNWPQRTHQPPGRRPARARGKARTRGRGHRSHAGRRGAGQAAGTGQRQEPGRPRKALAL